MKPRVECEGVAMNKTSKDLTYPNMTQDEPERVIDLSRAKLKEAQDWVANHEAMEAEGCCGSTDAYMAASRLKDMFAIISVSETRAEIAEQQLLHESGLCAVCGEANGVKNIDARTIAAEKRAEEAERLYAQICDAMDRSQSHLREAMSARDSSQASLLRARAETLEEAIAVVEGFSGEYARRIAQGIRTALSPHKET